MIDYHALPAVNATLNGIATVLLVSAYVMIRQKRVRVHQSLMLSAFMVSILFLVSYVVYHAHVGSKPFPHTGLLRTVYFAILIPHVLLAITVPPLAIITLSRALKGNFAAHKKIARVTFPIWLYVSVTGVIVYLMLYQL